MPENISVTDLINTDAVTGVAKDTAVEMSDELLKKIIFFSGYIIRWLTDLIASTGLNIPEQSVTAGMVIIFIILLMLVLKFVQKFVLKFALVVAILWFIAGFFMVPE